MTEKVLNKSKNGMLMMILLLLTLVVSFIGIIIGIDRGGIAIVLGVLCILIFIAACICLGGLKVLKPQEALVLTLFGDYVGTLKGEGFYWVNPFCAAVNPAARTVLNQSGDDPEQQQAEDQRLSGQSCRNRHRGYVARGGYRQGCLQC